MEWGHPQEEGALLLGRMGWGPKRNFQHNSSLQGAVGCKVEELGHVYSKKWGQ